MGRGFFKAHHDGAQIRHPQPIRHKAAQDAFAMAFAVMVFGRRVTFSSNHQHQTGVIELALVQKAAQPLMRFMRL